MGIFALRVYNWARTVSDGEFITPTEFEWARYLPEDADTAVYRQLGRLVSDLFRLGIFSQARGLLELLIEEVDTLPTDLP